MRRWVEGIQRLYPQVYIACHVDHVRARSNSDRLSAKDSSVLSHLDERVGVGAATLARHLRIRPSSLSPVLARLERLGLLARRSSSADRRRQEILLTRAGVAAIRRTSVLDFERLSGLARALDPAERARAMDGLALLAEAARRVAVQGPRRSTRKDERSSA